MPGRARKLIVTERQQTILQTIVRSSTCPQAVAQRARMILSAFDGLSNEEIAEHVGCERHAVDLLPKNWST